MRYIGDAVANRPQGRVVDERKERKPDPVRAAGSRIAPLSGEWNGTCAMR
jgi:hypothetical protein